MKTIQDFWQELCSRWRNAMPRFFKRMMWICGLISGSALAANEAMTVAGIQPHEWWTDVLPYLVGVPAGVMFACKFTQSYDRDGHPLAREVPEATRPSSVNQSDVETVSAPQKPADIDPYNEG